MQTVDADPPPLFRHPPGVVPMPQPEPSPSPGPPPTDRKAMRRTARVARAAFVAGLDPAIRGALQKALASHVLPHLGTPGLIGSHAAVGDEIDPRPLEAAALALGWSLAFPRVTEGPLSYHEAGRDGLEPGYKGIPEPSAVAPLARPDVLLVPVMAVDLAGNRLGQGGGHYDRTLAALRASGPVLAIGLCWDMQLVPHIPAAAWDQPLDAIATPTAFHLAASAARRAS